jgi:hypothetical protein
VCTCVCPQKEREGERWRTCLRMNTCLRASCAPHAYGTAYLLSCVCVRVGGEAGAAGYILVEIPSNLMLKRVNPALWYARPTPAIAPLLPAACTCGRPHTHTHTHTHTHMHMYTHALGLSSPYTLPVHVHACGAWSIPNMHTHAAALHARTHTHIQTDIHTYPPSRFLSAQARRVGLSTCSRAYLGGPGSA